MSLDKLKLKWVDKSIVVYVGKAGGNNAATLRSRISQYIKFGNGQPIGHWGGRYIWQMEDVDDLLLCWMKTPEYMPRQKEVELLSDHETKYQALPFANLKK